MVDSSVLCRTISTTTTYPETVFDSSINAYVLRTDGLLSYIDISTNIPQRDGKLYRPDTHLYVDTSIVENIYSKFEKTLWDEHWMLENRYKELNERIIHARDKFFTDYLTFTANEDSYISFHNNGTNNPTIHYYKNYGEWENWTADTSIKLNKGDFIKVRSINENGFSKDTANYTNFVMSGSISASGSVMTLIDGNNPKKEIRGNYCFCYLFNNCMALMSSPDMPATTLTECCYYYMFNRTNTLPDCSAIDFSDKENVIKKKALMGLFAGTKVTDNDLNEILPHNPETGKYWLPEKDLSGCNNCYQLMFSNTHYLSHSPELPATTLAPYCYNSMFSGFNIEHATYLPTPHFINDTPEFYAPVLPAKTLVAGCYKNMFLWNLRIKRAPDLLADVLPTVTTENAGCYDSMFHQTFYINRIKVMASTLNRSSNRKLCPTHDWVSQIGVRPTVDQQNKVAGFGGYLPNHENNCPFIIRKSALSQWLSMPHNFEKIPYNFVYNWECDIKYVSEHGTYPEGFETNREILFTNFSNNTGYILTQNDLPELHEDGWVFNGWNKNPGDKLTAESNIITASWTKIE